MPIDEFAWISDNQKQTKSVSIGRFYLCGTHLMEAETSNKIVLRLDAVTTFGSGNHASTEGCLRALEHIFDLGCSPRSILDLGTGSGVLAMAAIKLWPNSNVLASDIDKESIRVARLNAEVNGIAKIDYIISDGVKAFEIKKNVPFDLIFANILANTLKELSSELDRLLLYRGYVILSGMLEGQRSEVLVRYTTLGFKLIFEFKIQGWVTLLIQK